MNEVSVYIPAYNAEKTLPSCIESLLAQTFPIKEILVVDDGSTDGTSKVCCAYPVKLIKHSANLGLAAARNTALKNLDAEFIAAIDSDCIAEKAWLGLLMEEFKSPIIAGAGGLLLEDSSSSVFDLWRSRHMKQFWDDTHSPIPPFLFGANTVFRKKSLLEAGMYNELLGNNYEDVDISRRIKQSGDILVYASKAVVHHLRTDDLSSLLNTFWKWHLQYYIDRDFYMDKRSFKAKIRDNMGLANRFLEEDKDYDRRLVYIDFLLAIHHTLKDFNYFLYRRSSEEVNAPSKARLWLSLLDIVFFARYDSMNKRSMRSLIPRSSAFAQNFLASNLLMGSVLEKYFSFSFRRNLFKHLLISVYNIHDEELNAVMSNLLARKNSWNCLAKKAHPNIDAAFEAWFAEELDRWLGELAERYPKISGNIDFSSRDLEQASSKTQGGSL